MKLMIRVKGRALQAQRPGKVRKREKEDDHIFLFFLFLIFSLTEDGARAD
jgi:hypothetical protein